MLRHIIDIFDILFFHPKGDLSLEKILLDKTEYYQKEYPEVLDGVYVATRYNLDAKDAIESFKYKGNREYIDSFNSLLIETSETYISMPIDIATGVPMFFLQWMVRHYNHSYLLARTFATSKNIPFLEVLRKKRYTRHQARLDRQHRQKNIKSVFSVPEKYSEILTGKTILIIDDVISTGATAVECARALKAAGANRVIGLFLATGD